MRDPLKAARAYLEKLPGAVSGAGGHGATFRAACEVVRFGLSDADAMMLLREFNGRCTPAWKDKELEHKLADARRAAGGQSRPLPQTKPAERVTWKIERKTPLVRDVEAIIMAEQSKEPEVHQCQRNDFMPYRTAGGTLVIPFASPERYHWWKDCGMRLADIRREYPFGEN
jgi:hypothetical protein